MKKLVSIPAFPGSYTGHCGNDNHQDPCGCYVESGMSLRDYFAGQALSIVRGSDVAEVAKDAYALADAMLAERAKGLSTT